MHPKCDKFIDTDNDTLLTLKEAAKRFSKSVSNVSYLIQYGHLNKYNPKGELIDKAKSGELRVSLKELQVYFTIQDKQLDETRQQINGMNEELAFFNLSEKERTKHVHRLHPYLGKYIPQLVEYYLKKAFKPGSIILDPFLGSGTTLVEANVQNVESFGIDISEFNCMIARAKTTKYSIPIIKKELLDIYKRTERFSKSYAEVKKKTPSILDYITTESESSLQTNEFPLLSSEYINKWFPDQTIAELSFYKSLIPEYTYPDLLNVVLTRSARSARLTLHFELTRPIGAVWEPYYCHKHKGKICAPIRTCIRHIKRYTTDTIRRIIEFDKIRSDVQTQVVQGDSRFISLEDKLDHSLLDGVITSPPYVGVLDYHDQHRYAYDILGLPWNASKEIGPAEKGGSKAAQSEYQEGITQVLKNIRPYLKDNARLFIVANDKKGLYPKIATLSNYEITNRDLRPVTKKASRERLVYSETIFEFRPDN